MIVDGGRVGTVQLAPPARGPTTRWRRGWSALAWVAGLANLTFLLRPVVGSGLAPLRTEVSALSVDGQPLAWVFRSGDVVFGVATVLLGVGVLARPEPWRGGTAPKAFRWDAARLLAAGLFLSGAANVVAAAVPETSTGESGVGDLFGSSADATHAVASLLAGVGLVVAATTCAAGLAGPDRSTRRVTVRFAAGLAVALVALSVTEAVGEVVGTIPVSGAVQRVQIVASSVWTVLVGALLRGARDPRR